MEAAFKDRLLRALGEHAPTEIRGDKKAFQLRMRDSMGSSEDSRHGTSYPAILGYFSGATTPALPWVKAAADILGVRASWLAFGDGEPTLEQQRIREGAAENPWASMRSDVPDLEDLDPAVGAMLAHLIIRSVTPFVRLGIVDGIDDPNLAGQLAADWWRYVQQPLLDLEATLERRIRMDPRDVSDYAIAMIQALLLLLGAALPAELTKEEVEAWPKLDPVSPAAAKED